MTDPNKIDIAVIGAGAVGISCALYLQEKGYKVTVFDKLEPKKACSYGNAGHFATELIAPLSSPAVIPQIPAMLLNPLGPVSLRFSYLHRITPWFIRYLLAARPKVFQYSSKALQALNEQSIPAFQHLLTQANAADQLKMSGSLLTFESDKSFNGWKKEADWSRKHGVKIDIWNQQQVREAEPDLNQQIKYGAFFPDTGHTENPGRMIDTLIQHFVANGGQIIKGYVQEMRGSYGAPYTRLLTPNGTIKANKVVVSAGIWSRQFAKMLAHDFPLDTERGYHLMMPDPKVKLSIPVTSAERKFIMTPMEEGLRLAGTVEFGGIHLPMNKRRADMLYGLSKAMLPGLRDMPNEQDLENLRWMGFRPSFPDSLPVIDESSHQPGVYFACGHQHLGLTQAAITGKLISEMINHEKTTIDVSPFKMNRF